MKTLRITDDVHQKLTALLGELTAQTSRMQTYTDAVEALLKQSIVLPPELLDQIESLIKTYKHFGYTSREEFIRDAARWRLRYLTGTYEYIEVNKDKYQKSDAAIKEMNLPYLGAADFADKQIEVLLEKYSDWQQQREEQERRQRKKGT
jgi:Arc/MetJ-type ribon-helix-helix transcriptional regulator